MIKWLLRLVGIGVVGFIGYGIYDYYKAGLHTRPPMPEGAFSLSFKAGPRVIMLNTEDEDCVPVWPNEEFAQAWATDQWQECRPEAISLNKWFSRWTHGLADDELAIVVFPSQDEQGLVYYPDELEHELKQKQHSVKKR